MIIYDQASKRVLSELTLFLTPTEAAELADSARDLSLHPTKQHQHIPGDPGFQTELILAVFTPETLSAFDDEARGVIARSGSLGTRDRGAL